MTAASLRRPRVVKRCAKGHAIEGANARILNKRPAECLTCWMEWQEAVRSGKDRLRAAREKRSAEARARREARAAGLAPAAPAPRPVPPFDQAVAELERVFGPYAGWTRAQHQRCTERMYELLGWPADGPRQQQPPRAGRQLEVAA